MIDLPYGFDDPESRAMREILGQQPEPCAHPSRCLVDPRPTSSTGGPERVWVATCSKGRGGCGDVAVLGLAGRHGGARGRGSSEVVMTPTMERNNA